MIRWLVVVLAVAACGASSAPAGDPDDPLANPPKLLAAELAYKPADVAIALELARAKLKTLDRYPGWQHEHLRYDTDIYVGDGGKLYVEFNTPDVTDQNVTIVVDVVARKIVDVRLGAA